MRKTVNKKESCMKLTAFIVAVFILIGCSPQKISGGTGHERTAQDLLEQGKEHFEKADYNSAIADFTQAILIDPNMAEAYTYRSWAHGRNNNNEQALIDANEAIRCNPQLAMGYFVRGRLQSDNDRAIADYNEAIRLDPNHVDAYNNRGVSYENKNDYDRAIADYIKAIRLNPHYIIAYSNYDRVIAYLTQAILLDPNNANAKQSLEIARQARRQNGRSAGYEMVRVPGGSFQMGDTAGDGDKDERPVHTVTLSTFSIGKYEVTQGLYAQVMWNTPSTSRGANLPVEHVTWYDAVEFCNKLSEMEGLQPVYAIYNRSPAEGYPIESARVIAGWSKNGYRLPTEAQWEYAAKGGNGSPGNYPYSGSNNADEVAWCGVNSGDIDLAWVFSDNPTRTRPVGTKKPNRLGIYDMSGNVWEWCWDWYGTYPSTAQTDPTGASSGSDRVWRGGSWIDRAEWVRSAFRSASSPSFQLSDIGFRLVRPVP